MGPEIYSEEISEKSKKLPYMDIQHSVVYNVDESGHNQISINRSLLDSFTM